MNNFVVFVAGSQVGERLRIRVEKVLDKFAIAQSTGPASGASESKEAPAAQAAEESSEEEGTEEGTQ